MSADHFERADKYSTTLCITALKYCDDTEMRERDRETEKVRDGEIKRSRQIDGEYMWVCLVLNCESHPAVVFIVMRNSSTAIQEQHLMRWTPRELPQHAPGRQASLWGCVPNGILFPMTHCLWPGSFGCTLGLITISNRIWMLCLEHKKGPALQ